MRNRMNKYSLYLAALSVFSTSPLLFASSDQDQFLDSQYISAGMNWSKISLPNAQSHIYAKRGGQYDDLSRLEPVDLQSTLNSHSVDLFDELWVSSYKLQNQNREILDLRSQRKAAPVPHFKPTIYQSKGIYSDANVRIETEDKIIISVGPRAEQ